jgi:ATP-dependent Clp protease ATP-binding subunit ClpA
MALMQRPALKVCAAALSTLIALLSPGAPAYAGVAGIRLAGGRGAPPRLALPEFGPAPDPTLGLTPSVLPLGVAPSVPTPPVAHVALAATPAGAPLALAERTATDVGAILADHQADKETLRTAAALTFEDVRPGARELEASVSASPLLRTAASGLGRAPREMSPQRQRTFVPSVAVRRIVERWRPEPKMLQIAVVAVTAIILSNFAPLVAAPFILGTCPTMKERAIKDATILPERNNQAQHALAKLELDTALVAFGKQMRLVADADARVQSELSAHDAEHAMEEPLLELLPRWKGLWSEGKGPSKEEALAELREAVLARLQKKVLTREDRALVEELLHKSGGWDRLLEWEQKYGVLDALKKAAGTAAENRVAVKKQAGESGDHGLRGGAGMLGALLVVAVGLMLAHLGGVAGAAVGCVALIGMVAQGSAQKSSAPVDLGAFLENAGLSEEDVKFLKQFTTDIGARDMAPIIGRSKEIQRVITILSKPAGIKNNPMLLGDQGVGKTAVVEAVARYLYENRLPSLSGKRILALDMGKLAAGANLQGEIEHRLTMLHEVIARTNHKVVLFVDEIHTLLKNNTISNVVPDLLKTPLRNAEITMIGATTTGEYRQYMEKDPAFADRFDPVAINEPTQEEAIEMLEGNLEYLEKQFGVAISPAAAQAAVRLSARYIPEKFLPRKAHDLLTNAIAEAKPEAARDGFQVQIDQFADRLRIFVRRYAGLAKSGDGGDAVKRAEIVRAYNRVVSTYQTILTLEDRQRALVAERIDTEHVERTLAKETGLDVGEMGVDDYAKLAGMVPWFKDRIVGQDDAISALAEAVRRNRAKLSDPDRPLGVFLFPGPTGVGKTEIAKRLAEFLFNDPDAMTRIDMQEYQEKFSVLRLFGAPPGYVGYEQGGQLTEAVRRKPYSVVLFDEIEKAHPDVLVALLQVFDDGRMTDGKGKVVNFKNTIIIMTSNMGAQAEDAEQLMALLRAQLKLEFINRIDKIVRFNNLTKDKTEVIVNIQLDRVRKRLRAQDLEMVVSPAAMSWLAEKGYDPVYGARPVKRLIESSVTDKIGEYLLAQRADGTLVNGGLITIGVEGDALSFALKPNPPPVVEMSPLPEGPLGAKLRGILEEALRTGGEEDLRKFEALLFPERYEVVREGSLGAFEPDAPAPKSGADSAAVPLTAAVGERDPGFSKLRDLIAARTESRWDEPRREAARAWLDAFSRLAKGLKTNAAPSAAFATTADSGLAVLTITVPAEESQRQELLRLARDHFSVPLADEAAARKRAAALKDAGKQADIALLEAKRLIESVPGARFGFKYESSGAWKFWLALPIDANSRDANPVEVKPGTPDAAELPASDQADAPLTPREARSSPGSMMRYLAPAAATPLGALRRLAADMLDSKAVAVRLMGLHLASGLLPKNAFAEIVGISRGMRINSDKDVLLFADLVARSAAGMRAQRKSVRDSFDGLLRAHLEAARDNRDRAIMYSDRERLYARAVRQLGEGLNADESRVARKASREISGYVRWWLPRFLMANATVFGLAYGLWHFAGLSTGIILAISVSVTLFVWLSSAMVLSEVAILARGNSDAIDSFLIEVGDDAVRLKIAASWLRRAARGQIEDFQPQDVATAIAQTGVANGDPGRRVFERWIQNLEKAFDKPGPRLTSETDGERALSLIWLGYMYDVMPIDLRPRATALLLRPLSERWLPSSAKSYGKSLGAWLERADLTAAELDATIDALAVFPVNDRSVPWTILFPPISGLARQPLLSSGQRVALDDIIAGFVAEYFQGANNNVTPALVALIRATRVPNAWELLREVLSARSFNSEIIREVLGEVAAMIAKVPPGPSDRAWLEPKLRELSAAPEGARGAALLALAQLADEPSERIALLLDALGDLYIWDASAAQSAQMTAAIADLHAAVARLRAANAPEAEAIERAVEANLTRLAASEP